MLGFILSLLLAPAAGTLLHSDPVADQLIREAMKETYSLRLPEARKAAEALEARYVDHPVGYTLMANTYWWEAQMDPGNSAIEKAYYKAQETAVDKAEKALKLNKYPVSELAAYLSATWGSHAEFQITQKGAYFSAMRSGLRSHRYAEQAHALDPEDYDVWLGLGAYNYFTGSLPSVIKPFAWLIGARGDRNLGLEQLRTCMERARYARTEARIVYYTALLEDGQFAAAFPVLERLIADFPDNYVVYTWVTEWYREQRKNAEGAEYFEKVYETQIERSPHMAQYALFERAQLQNAQGFPADARGTVARLRAIAPTDPLLSKKLQAFERSLR